MVIFLLKKSGLTLWDYLDRFSLFLITGITGGLIIIKFKIQIFGVFVLLTQGSFVIQVGCILGLFLIEILENRRNYKLKLKNFACFMRHNFQTLIRWLDSVSILIVIIRNTLQNVVLKTLQDFTNKIQNKLQAFPNKIRNKLQTFASSIDSTLNTAKSYGRAYWITVITLSL